MRTRSRVFESSGVAAAIDVEANDNNNDDDTNANNDFPPMFHDPPWYSDSDIDKDRSEVIPPNRAFDYVASVPGEGFSDSDDDGGSAGKSMPDSTLQNALANPSSRIIPFSGSNVYVRRLDGNANEARGQVEPLFLKYNECPTAWFENDKNTLCWLGKNKDGSDCFAVDIGKQLDDDENDSNDTPTILTAPDIESSSVRTYGDVMPSRTHAALLSAANGLLSFHRSHRFCSRCGSPTSSIKAGAARKCTDADCRTSVYPRIDAAVIMLVTSPCDDYALLGRKRSWPPGRYSTLAGFMEVGETLEECVARETYEESGVRVDGSSIRFVASQPWPFPRSLMVGFHGRALPSSTSSVAEPVDDDDDDDESNNRKEGNDDGSSTSEKIAGLPKITVDPAELEDAQWFRKDYVKQYGLVRGKGSSALEFVPDEMEREFHVPGPASLARLLIAKWAMDE